MNTSDPSAAPLFSTPARARDGAPSDAGWRILVVEDDRVDRLALRRHVADQRLPYELVEAATVAEACARLARETFDAVLLDQNLPDGSGFEVFPAAGDVPVVFVTGADDLALAVRAVKAGAADYLVKDVARHYLRMLPLTLERARQERRMKRELQASQARLRQILDYLPVPAFACDADGFITYYNRQTLALWGRAPRLADPADRYCASVQFLRLDGTPLVNEECWRELTQRSGLSSAELIAEFGPENRHNLLAYATPMLDGAGKFSGLINLWIDVTAMRRLESRQRVLESHFQHARKLEAIGTLAGGVAHEFNNLLTSIMGNLQLAQLDLPAQGASGQFLRDALRSSRRARDMVQRMLTFSQGADDSRHPARLEPLIVDAVQLLRSTLPAGVTIRTNLPPASPDVRCSAAEINQAILQLGLNAGQAMQGRGGTLELTLVHGAPEPAFCERHPQVGAHLTVRLSVRDTGVGMSAAVLERIFEPFFTTRSPGQGSGLGLAGVYGIMKRHGGVVVVESTPGLGTTVYLCFPEATNGPRTVAGPALAAADGGGR